MKTKLQEYSITLKKSEPSLRLSPTKRIGGGTGTLSKKELRANREQQGSRSVMLNNTKSGVNDSSRWISMEDETNLQVSEDEELQAQRQ